MTASPESWTCPERPNSCDRAGEDQDQNLETQRKRRKQRIFWGCVARKFNPPALFFRALIFLLGRQVRNIDTLPWMKPPGPGGPNRTLLSFVFLRVSVPPWSKGLVFGFGFVALRFKVLFFAFPHTPPSPSSLWRCAARGTRGSDNRRCPADASGDG